MKLCIPGALTSLGTLTLLGALSLTVACEDTGGAADVVPVAESEFEKVCGRAYGGQDGARKKMMQALTEEQQKQVTPLPSREDFVKLCTSLPDEATAKCLDPNWYAVDQAACEELFKKLDEAKTKEIQALFSGAPEKEEEAEAAEGGEAAEGEGGAEKAGDAIRDAN